MAPHEPQTAGGRYRSTAADWHGGQSSPLYAYASTGAVVAGIDGEIRDCLALVEQGALGRERDPVVEHQRLRALLHHVEPQLAVAAAGQVGHDHGTDAAAWWQQDALAGRATGDTAATAGRVLQGIDDGDPAVLDALPAPDGDYTAAELSADCGWLEPDLDDREAHDRWAGAQDDIRDAYTAAFVEATQDSVARHCQHALAGDVDRHVAALDRTASPAGPAPAQGLEL